ncbi:MAG: hypothetical protein Q7K40_02660 [bacterium]|nr:hypothetical protein [bacterium]
MPAWPVGVDAILLITNVTKVAIIGAGPAGTVFYDLLVRSRKYTQEDILLLDMSGDVCPCLSRYNAFVENTKSKCSPELRFLVDGKITGTELRAYFRNKYPFPVKGFYIKEICKNENGLFKLTSTAGSILTEKVILATGIKQKLLPEIVFGGDREKYDFTFKKFTEFQKIDFKNNEVIFIGSGDNVLFKSHRLAEWIATNAIPHSFGCIKIFIKNVFKNDNNPKFYRNVQKYVEKGMIEIVVTSWDVKTIKTNRCGLVSEIQLADGICKIASPGGAYLSIHTGNIIDIPVLVDCTVEDLILIGDLNLFKNGQICSIYDSILDAEKKAFDFIQNHGY